MKRQILSGFSLAELLIVTAIAGLIGVLAIPSIDAMVARNRTTAEINRLVGAINLTRHTAVRYGYMTTICGLKPSGKCGGPWQGQLSIFLDKNRNAKLDNKDVLISRVQSFGTGATIRWRAFQNRQYLQLTPMGYTNYQNGNFVVCPDSGNPAEAKQLVINIQGRSRINRRLNEAGRPVDSKGRPLRC